MVNEQDKIMKSKLPSTKELWNVTVKMFDETIDFSLYEIETKCGKLLLVSNEVWYYKSEDIKHSAVKNILNEKIRLQIMYNRLMLFGLVTLNENQYNKTSYFDMYKSDFGMSFEMKDLRQFEIKYPGIYDYIPKNSKKYDDHIRGGGRIHISEKQEPEEIEIEELDEDLEEAIDETLKVEELEEIIPKDDTGEMYELIKKSIEKLEESILKKINNELKTKPTIETIESAIAFLKFKNKLGNIRLND